MAVHEGAQEMVAWPNRLYAIGAQLALGANTGFSIGAVYLYAVLIEEANTTRATELPTGHG